MGPPTECRMEAVDPTNDERELDIKGKHDKPYQSHMRTLHKSYRIKRTYTF